MALARVPYAKRRVNGTYDAGWMATEFGNIQRALPSMKVEVVKSGYQASTSDSVILCDTTAAAFTVSLPPAAQVKGLTLNIKKTTSDAHAVTIGGVVDGVSNPTLPTQYKSMTVVSDGSAWFKLASI